MFVGKIMLVLSMPFLNNASQVLFVYSVVRFSIFVSFWGFGFGIATNVFSEIKFRSLVAKSGIYIYKFTLDPIGVAAVPYGWYKLLR